MDNRTALFLAALVVAGLVADAVLWDGQGLLAIGRVLAAVIEYLAFWR